MNLNKLDSQVDSKFLSPNDERWKTYLESKPESTVFHHPAWLSALAQSYGYWPFIMAACDEKGEIRAGLPLMEVRSLVTGRRWVSVPFSDYCAPLYSDPESLNQLVRDLAILYGVGSVSRIEIRWELPAHPAIHSHPAYILHTVRLNSEPKEVLKGFKRTHRQNVGTAEKRGVHIEWGADTEYVRRFYEMQLETRRRKGLPVQPWKFFDLLEKKLLAQGLGFVLLALKDTQCLAGGVFLHWQHTLTYKYAASSDEGQEYRPNNLLSWVAMRWGCENGCTAFDLGKTSTENAGLRRFKRGWGAEEESLVYSTLPESVPDATDGKLMSYMETVIQRTPPWVCKTAGELLYKHFG
jgi:CelD/BcsL family acetyltransferase involved in cellulose biosynthesis